MSDPQLNHAWDRFWFSPAPLVIVARVRVLLCVITAIYFASCFSDAAFWYTGGGPLSPTRVSSFLSTGGLESNAKWIVSPLFLTESSWIYYLYLVAGIVVALMVAAGRGGRIASWALWLLLVGWANRAMILSGLGETLLSLGLFASAIAPPHRDWKAVLAKPADGGPQHWSTRLSSRLLATQITLIGAATFITMLGGRVWFNGLGAFAMAAPVADRTIDWTAADSLLVRPWFHESLTHLLVIALPVGFTLAWIRKSNRIGQATLIAWCIAVALLGSHWMYAAVFAAMVLAIRD